MSHMQKSRSWKVLSGLTGALLAEAAGVAEQLESLLEANCMLRGSIRGLDVRDEGAHLPLSLASGWRQQALVTLVQRAGADRLCHRQDGDLQRDKAISPKWMNFLIFQSNL